MPPFPGSETQKKPRQNRVKAVETRHKMKLFEIHTFFNLVWRWDTYCLPYFLFSNKVDNH